MLRDNIYFAYSKVVNYYSNITTRSVVISELSTGNVFPYFLIDYFSVKAATDVGMHRRQDGKDTIRPYKSSAIGS